MARDYTTERLAVALSPQEQAHEESVENTSRNLALLDEQLQRETDPKIRAILQTERQRLTQSISKREQIKSRLVSEEDDNEIRARLVPDTTDEKEVEARRRTTKPLFGKEGMQQAIKEVVAEQGPVSKFALGVAEAFSPPKFLSPSSIREGTEALETGIEAGGLPARAGQVGAYGTQAALAALGALRVLKGAPKGAGGTTAGATEKLLEELLRQQRKTRRPAVSTTEKLLEELLRKQEEVLRQQRKTRRWIIGGAAAIGTGLAKDAKDKLKSLYNEYIGVDVNPFR